MSTPDVSRTRHGHDPPDWGGGGVPPSGHGHGSGAGSSPRFGWGLAIADSPALAADGAVAQAADRALGVGDTSATIAVVCVGPGLAGEADQIARRVYEALRPRALIGVTASGVVGGRREVEGQPAVSVLAAHLPGVEPVLFTERELGDVQDESAAAIDRRRLAVGVGDDYRATILLADPLSVAFGPLVRALDAARTADRRGEPVGVTMGGLASGGSGAGGNALLINGTARRGGFVGLSLRGRLRVDTVVSQGCRPVGPAYVITRCARNLILELGGEPALEVVSRVVQNLSDEDREAMQRGLFMGRAVHEYKERFGRGDFLIRPIVGTEASLGGVAIGELARVGQTVRLHVRDAQTANEDLALLLDGCQLHGPPAGAFLATCTGRGRGLFGRPDHDAGAIQRAFLPEMAGEQQAKGGEEVTPSAAGVPVPLAGFFAAGEIGPVGGRTAVHGYTASLALFRDAAPGG